MPLALNVLGLSFSKRTGKLGSSSAENVRGRIAIEFLLCPRDHDDANPSIVIYRRICSTHNMLCFNQNFPLHRAMQMMQEDLD